MLNRLRSINWTYVVVKLVVLMFMSGAAAISFKHIVDVSLTLGLTWEAYTVPFFIDGLAILGLVGRTDKFDVSTKRAGLVLVITAGSLSLAANVTAGDNLGQQAYGALVVCGFALAEWFAGRMKAAPVPVRVVDEATRTKRSEAARKAAATRKANARKLKRARKATTVAELEAAYAAESAPVSPAPAA